MRTLFEMGFRSNFGRPTLGQWSELATIASGLFAAGGAAYGAHMQQNIAKMQLRFEKERVAKEEAAAKAREDAAKKTEEQIISQGGVPGGLGPKILGVDRDVVVLGGVGLALLVGIIAIVATSSKKAPELKAVAA